MVKNIYIHVPFCREKCDYCCFYSEENANSELQLAYLNKLEAQLAGTSFNIPLDTLYIGGGTPTLLTVAQLQQFFNMLKKYLPLDSHTEISIECNPASVTPEKAPLIINFANRISIGIQSFQPAHRDTLGRRVSNEEIARSLELLGGSRFNLDLIYAIPGQTMATWLDDVEQAIDSGASHLSCYSLTLEEGTRLAEQCDMVINDDISAEMWLQTAKVLHDAGMERYEISNYAIKGNECRHNLNIWRGQAYLGFGPAAASFDGVKRWTQPSSLADWLKDKSPEIDLITPDARAREIFAMGLRLTAGWSRQAWEECACPEIPEWSKMIALTDEENFIHTADQVKLKPEMILFWDDIASNII